MYHNLYVSFWGQNAAKMFLLLYIEDKILLLLYIEIIDTQLFQ